MSTFQELLIIAACLSSVTVFVLWKPDSRMLLRWSVQGFVGLGVLAVIAHFLDRFLQGLKSVAHRTQNSHVESRDDVLQRKEKQEKILDEKQAQYSQQAAEYEELVLRPKREAAAESRHDEHYRFSGPAWKGKRNRLGGMEQESGAESSLLRQFTQQNTQYVGEQAVSDRKKKMVLEAEPCEGDDVITVSFRTPLRIHRRRFRLSDTVQTLLDYVQSCGYHPDLHHLYSTYPRGCVSYSPHQSLTQAGITHNCTLNVEERD